MDARLDMPGAWDAIRSVPPSLSPISLNKTLYVTKLSDDFNMTPDPVTGLESVEDVLEHFKPEVNVSLTDEKGGMTVDTFRFREMGDFTKEGLVGQNELMRDLDQRILDLQRMDMQLRANRLLQEALKDDEIKQVMLDMIQQMLAEIEQAG